MVIVMFPAGVLIWLTVASALVLAGRHLISSRRLKGQRLIRLAASYGRAAAVPVILLSSLPGPVQQSGRPSAGQNAYRVAVAAALIERTLPGRPAVTLSVSARKPNRYQVFAGLLWALTGDGYSVELTRRARTRPMSHVTILIRDNKMTVDIRKTATSNLVATVHPGERNPLGPRRGVSPDLRRLRSV